MSEEIQANEFYKLFKRHLNGNKSAQLRVVQCVSVNWRENTMTAKDSEGLEYFDVSLGFGSVLIKPAVDSLCVIGLLEGQDTATWLLHTEKADEVVVQGEKMTVKVNDRLMVKNDRDNLKSLLDDLLKAIKAMKFTTNTGATIDLVNIADFVSIEKRIEKLLMSE